MSERAKATVKTPESKTENSASQTNKTTFSHSINSPIDQILFLQRTVGNQTVEKLLKSGVIQAKLTIGRPGDIYEQEADRVADEVMRMPDPSTAGRKRVSEDNKFPSIQKMCTDCEEELHRQPMEEEEELLQTKEVSGSTPEVTSSVESQINSVRGGGQPLSESARAFFEPRFGKDFSGVRIHTDSNAGESVKAVNAMAYTVGRDVVFGAGQYAPETESGKKLIAHELTHVVQQRGVHSSIVSHSLMPRLSWSGSDQLMRQIAYDPDCQPRQEEVERNITRAQASAARWARAGSTSLLNPQRDAGLLRRHFGLTPILTAAINRVRRTLTVIAGHLEADAFTYHCRPDSDTRCHGQDGGLIHGFAYPGGFHIFFCPPFPYQDFFGHRSLIDTLLHEAAHAHDAAFNHDTYEHDDTYPPVNAVTNADSYASFARDTALGVGVYGLELTLGGVMAPETQFYVAVGNAGDVGGPFLDVLNLRLGQRIAFTPRAGEEPARFLTTADIGLRINPIRERVYVDITTGAFFGVNFTDDELMAGIANRLTLGYRGERVDLGLDLSQFLDLVAEENMMIVGVRGAIRLP